MPKEYSFEALLEEHQVQPRSASEMRAFIELFFQGSVKHQAEPLLSLLLKDKQYRASELGILMQTAVSVAIKLANQAIEIAAFNQKISDLQKQQQINSWESYAESIARLQEEWQQKVLQRKVYSERQRDQVLHMVPGLSSEFNTNPSNAAVILERIRSFVTKWSQSSALEAYVYREIQTKNLSNRVYLHEPLLVRTFAFEIILFLGFYRKKYMSRLNIRDSQKQSLEIELRELVVQIKQDYF